MMREGEVRTESAKLGMECKEKRRKMVVEKKEKAGEPQSRHQMIIPTPPHMCEMDLDSVLSTLLTVVCVRVLTVRGWSCQREDDT